VNMNLLVVTAMKICLDPGGGGPKAGGGIEDWPAAANLAVARRLARILEREGQRVLLTRTEDEAVSLARRVALANNAGAKLFVSIHCNSDRDSTVGGTETYYFRRGGRGEQLAGLIQTALVRELDRPDRGVQEGYRVHGGARPIYVLVHTRMPAVVVKPLFHTNPTEAALLQSTAGHERLARAIAAGILQYLGRRKKIL
jgi:N-acetylmuramoyl-L-alanine amidase